MITPIFFLSESFLDLLHDRDLRLCTLDTSNLPHDNCDECDHQIDGEENQKTFHTYAHLSMDQCERILERICHRCSILPYRGEALASFAIFRKDQALPARVKPLTTLRPGFSPNGLRASSGPHISFSSFPTFDSNTARLFRSDLFSYRSAQSKHKSCGQETDERTLSQQRESIKTLCLDG